MTELSALKKAVKIIGSQTLLAKKLGVTQQVVSWWLLVAKRVPANYVLKIEKLCNREITRFDLRPDIYPLYEE